MMTLQERKPKFETLSGIEAKRVYTPEDGARDTTRNSVCLASIRSRARASDDVSWALLDDAPVRGLRERGRIERALQIFARAGQTVCRRIRFADADRLRFRRGDGRRRSRQSRVAISSLEDMERLFDGIPLGRFRLR